MSARTGALALVLAACSPRSAAPARDLAAPPPTIEHRRFAVGVTPRHCLPALVGEAPSCCYEFAAGAVLARPDAGAPRLVHPGPFTGTCGGRSFDHVVFEAVRVAAVKVSLAASNRGLIGDRELDDAPLLLDAAHPEWTISLAARPLDEAGAPLETGADAGLHGLARWRWGAGCDRVVAAQPYERAGEGFERPSDDVQLVARAPGTCELEVAYGDVATKATIRVR